MGDDAQDGYLDQSLHLFLGLDASPTVLRDHRSKTSEAHSQEEAQS